MRIKSLIDPPTVRVQTMEVHSVVDLIEARLAGRKDAMAACKALCEKHQKAGYARGRFRGMLDGVALSITGLALGVLAGAIAFGALP